ncbi:MAG: PIG-L deacetylase family protein [Thermodesulfobacteriota bacterium]
MDKRMNILAIGAHPDDIEFGCGGTLLKYGIRGHKIYLLIMSKGDRGGDMDVRMAEQTASAQIMNASGLFWGNAEDTRLAVDLDTIQYIEGIMSVVKPDFIFCHYHDDTHQDHRHLAQIVISATRYVRNVMFYEGPTTQRFDPSVFVDISETIDKKRDLLKAHQSQVARTNIEGLSILDIANAGAVFRGIQGRVKYAEAFSPLRLFINI